VVGRIWYPCKKASDPLTGFVHVKESVLHDDLPRFFAGESLALHLFLDLLQLHPLPSSRYDDVLPRLDELELTCVVSACQIPNGRTRRINITTQMQQGDREGV
jgi:hypothetical protein